MLVNFPRLTAGRLLSRSNRFITTIRLRDDTVVQAHCPNSGRMTGCITPEGEVRISRSDNPNRKLKYTLELTRNETTWICVNTGRANELVHQALLKRQIPEFAQYQTFRREVKYGRNSRIDVLAEGNGMPPCYIEVKSVTMLNDAGQYCFPDAPTSRGRKHLEELSEMKQQGARAVMFFCVMREDGTDFAPADFIDPDYARLLKQVVAKGVEAFAYQAGITPRGLKMKQRLAVELA